MLSHRFLGDEMFEMRILLNRIPLNRNAVFTQSFNANQSIKSLLSARKLQIFQIRQTKLRLIICNNSQ